MLLRRLLRPGMMCAAFLSLTLPSVAHERLLPYFVSEPPVPVAYHPHYRYFFQAYEQFVRLSLHPSQWRTLRFIEMYGLRKIADHLHWHPSSDDTITPWLDHGSDEIARRSWVYPALERLKQAHMTQVASSDCYFREPTERNFTRYEVAVIVQRATTLYTQRHTDARGIEWETCRISSAMRCQQAHDLLDLCSQFKPELEAIGVERRQTELLTRTLEAYLHSRDVFAR